MPDGPIEQLPDGSLRIRVKAVPGARCDEIAGLLGDRLKVRISAPPEGGRANRAICELVAGALGVRAREVSVVAGPSNPEKVLLVRGVDAPEARRRLGV